MRLKADVRQRPLLGTSVAPSKRPCTSPLAFAVRGRAKKRVMRAKTRLILWWPALPPAPVVALPPAFSGQEALAIRKMAYVEALPQAWFATNQVDLYAGQRRRGLSSNAAVHRAQRDRHLDSWLNPCRSHRARTGCRRLHLRTQCRPDVSGFAAQFPSSPWDNSRKKTETCARGRFCGEPAYRQPSRSY